MLCSQGWGDPEEWGVAVGYGGDMDEKLCNGLLDDLNCNFYKVKYRRVDGMMPRLMNMVTWRG